MRFWLTFFAVCVLIALIAAMGNTNFQFASVQTLTSQLSDSKPETLFPNHLRTAVNPAIIKAQSENCIENPGFDRWVAVIKPLPENQRHWIKLKTHINAEFTDLDLTDDLPPIFASWFELPDSSRCNASPLKLSADEKNDLTTQSIRHINPDLAAFAFSYVVFKRSHDGIVNFSDTTIEVVGINVFYVAGMVVILALLLGLILFALYRCRHLYKTPTVVVLFAFNLAIITLMLTSSDKIVSFVGLIFHTIGIETKFNVQDYFTLAHAVVFALSSSLVLFLRDKTGLTVLKVIAIMGLLAFASEAFQMHVTSRSSSSEDLLYDFVGIAIGFIIWLIITLLLHTLKTIVKSSPPEQEQVNQDHD